MPSSVDSTSAVPSTFPTPAPLTYDELGAALQNLEDNAGHDAFLRLAERDPGTAPALDRLRREAAAAGGELSLANSWSSRREVAEVLGAEDFDQALAEHLDSRTACDGTAETTLRTLAVLLEEGHADISKAVRFALEITRRRDDLHSVDVHREAGERFALGVFVAAMRRGES